MMDGSTPKWDDGALDHPTLMQQSARCMGNGSFDFSKPMPNDQHSLAVQDCAKFCGLAKTMEELRQFTSTSIRRGNAMGIEVEVQRLRATKAKQFAWSPRSSTPRKHYCPEGVLLQPGPLFLDYERIDMRCLEVLGQAILEKHAKDQTLS